MDILVCQNENSLEPKPIICQKPRKKKKRSGMVSKMLIQCGVPHASSHLHSSPVLPTLHVAWWKGCGERQLDPGFTPFTFGKTLSLWSHYGIQDALKLQRSSDPASVSQGTESTGLDTMPGGDLGILFSESCVVQRCLPAWGEFCDLKRPTTPFPWNPPDRRSRVPLLEFFQHTTGRRLCR